MKINLSELSVILSHHSEIEFQVLGDTEYCFCCMGNMSDTNDDRAKTPYWFGLTADGKQAYEFTTFEELIKAPVFRGKSLQSIFDQINILTIDACDAELIYRSHLSNT